MRYCNLKFGYNEAGVKSTALQNCAGNKKHTLPRCGFVTTQIARHILCSIRFWCGFVCQGVFFLPMQFCKAVDFTPALLYPNFKLKYLMNYSSDFNNF